LTLKLYPVQANNGDCFLISIEENDLSFTILIDGGTKSAYKYLKKALVDLDIRQLDLLIVTHVDADHIDGINVLFDNLQQLRLTIKNVWLNAFEPKLLEDPDNFSEVRGHHRLKRLLLKYNMFIGSVTSFSIQAGVDLTEKIDNSTLNLDFYPSRIGDHDWRLVGVPWIQNISGKIHSWNIGSWQLHVIGPTKHNLEEFYKDWQERDPTPEYSNESSIMVLLENVSEEKRILLPGDGYCHDIEEGLSAAGLITQNITPEHPFPVNVLKLPHHGSSSNIVSTGGVYSQFFEKFPAEIAIISAKWNASHKNPDPETLKRLATAFKTRFDNTNAKAEIYATNDTPSLRDFREHYPDDQYHYKFHLKEGVSYFKFEV
jgi:beta-lactamase superfamily II metal-dependent hydrolase